MFGQNDLKSCSDSVPQGVWKAPLEASALLALGKPILANEEGGHGVVLTIIAAEVFYRVNTLPSELGNE